MQSQIDKVQQHWFLLESDFITAISKENISLLPGALARVDYLLGVVPKDLLEECRKGEEEALWSLHSFLHDNGWWVRACNLKTTPADKMGNRFSSGDPLNLFLHSYEHLIHPKTRQLAFEGDLEGIRMALNQIHYGSLPSKSKGKRVEASQGKAKGQASHTQSQVLKDFILGFKHLIEPSVFSDAMANNEKALSLALGQIHHKTLPENSVSQKSFKDTLLSKPLPTSSPQKSSKPFKHVGALPAKGPFSIFFTGFDEKVNAAQLWQLFKRAGAIKDIILPRKRDKYGNRFGFVVTTLRDEASKIINSLNGSCIGSSSLYLCFAKHSSFNSSKHHIHSTNSKLQPETQAPQTMSNLPKEPQERVQKPVFTPVPKAELREPSSNMRRSSEDFV